VSRYRWVDSQKAAGFPVAVACKVVEVSPSAYYDWAEHVAAGPTEAEWDEAILVNAMWDVHHHLDDTYGSPRMTEELRRRGFWVNHKRVERLMADNGLYARDGRRRKVRTTIPDVSAPPLPDLLQRDFSVGDPGERACGDITYVGTEEGWLFLADVCDIGSRRVTGFAMADHMRTELVASALNMAVAARGGEATGMVFHHDRGAQSVPLERVPPAL
jgi:transposase InsO family protein